MAVVLPGKVTRGHEADAVLVVPVPQRISLAPLEPDHAILVQVAEPPPSPYGEPVAVFPCN